MADTNEEEQLAASNASEDSSSSETADTQQPLDMEHPHPNVTVRRKGRYVNRLRCPAGFEAVLPQLPDDADDFAAAGPSRGKYIKKTNR